MSADQQDMINHLMMQMAQQQTGPSLYGLQAQPDPNALQALLGKMKQQQVLDQANAPTPGPYGYLHDAGKAAFNSIGSNLGGQLAAFGNGPQSGPNPQIQAQRDAISQGNQGVSSDLAGGVDPEQAKINALTKAAQAGLPGAADALDKAVEAQQKTMTARASAFKDTAQGNAATDEISNRAQQRALEQSKFGQSTAKDTWTTVGQGGGYIVQKNGLGEIKTSKNQDATTTQASAVTPSGLASILDYFHQNNKMPANLPKGVVGKAWEAEAQYQQQTGNIAASYAAQAASTKANTDALVQTQKSLSATSSYMATMDKNIKQAESLSKELDFGDVKKLNGAYQSWLSGTSDPKYAAYNLYFSSVASEFAKIKSGSFGNTPVSDSLQHQAMEDLNKTAGGLAPQALFDAVRTEGANRVTSLQAERDDLAGRIGKGGSFRPAGQASGAAPPQAPVAAAPQAPAAPPQVAPQQQYTEGQVAVNPQTGQKLTYTNGQWK